MMERRRDEREKNKRGIEECKKSRRRERKKVITGEKR